MLRALLLVVVGTVLTGCVIDDRSDGYDTNRKSTEDRKHRFESYCLRGVEYYYTYYGGLTPVYKLDGTLTACDY